MIRFSVVIALIIFIASELRVIAGEVHFEMSDRGFSHVVNQAIQKIDSAVKTSISFRSVSSNAPRSEDFQPTGSLTYRVSLEVREFRLDSIDMLTDMGDRSNNLKEALIDVRNKLLGYGVKRLHCEITILVAASQKDDDVNIKAKLYPRRIKIYADTNNTNSEKINTLISFLKDLILSRNQKLLLDGVAAKYLDGGLQLGSMFSITSPGFSSTKMINVIYHMGKINDLNPLVFDGLYTSNGKLHLIGNIKGQER